MKQDNDLSPELIRQITDHLMIERTALYPADLGFVFGSAPFCDDLADAVAKHYHSDYFNHIVVSGAPLTPKGIPEARHIFNELVQKGVDPDHIIVEDKALNTQENIELSQPLIDQKLGLDNVNTVIGFGQLYAARRYMMTLKRRWPEVFGMHVSVNGYPVERKDWPQHKDMRRKVLAEWGKLTAYKENDFIHEVCINSINKTVHSWHKRDQLADKNPKPSPNGPGLTP